MATIFEKLPISGEKCLILEPRESLIYPFDFGDWNELRMSVALSFTQLDSNDSFISNEKIVGGGTSATSMFFGLYSGNGNLPLVDNTAFIGFGNKTGASILMSGTGWGIPSRPTIPALLINSRSLPNANLTVEHSAAMSGFSSINNSVARTGYGELPLENTLSSYRNFFALPTGGSSVTPSFLNISGAEKYCVIETMGFRIRDKNLPGQSFDIFWDNNGPTVPVTDVSTINLQSKNTNQGTYLTGLYYNSNASPTGSPVDLPSKILIYSPFLQNRLRIHSLLLEKYA